MCLWNRPTRLARILRMLDAQDTQDGVHLYLWNNRRSDDRAYRSALANHVSRNALTTVDMVRSPFNLGAIARFYWVRRLVLHGYSGPVLVLDDDEEVGTEFVRSALSQYRPDTLACWWAFTVRSSYYDRVFAGPGDRVDYGGTGGMVCPAGIFAEPEFFTTIPPRFWLLDDMWLNHFAIERGFRLDKLEVHIEFVMDETNQSHGQATLKTEFWELLQGLK